VVLQYENLKEEMESKRALLEMLVKIRWKIRCGIGAEEGDFCNFDVNCNLRFHTHISD
jgi:hypothetical protein